MTYAIIQFEERGDFDDALEHEFVEPHDSDPGRLMVWVNHVNGVSTMVDGTVKVDFWPGRETLRVGSEGTDGGDAEIIQVET